MKDFHMPIRSFCTGILLACTFLFIPAFAASNTPSVGKVRYILGEVTVQKKAKNNWHPLRIGLKVRENDVIRTLVESEAGIALSDGSLITIEENTTIEFETAILNQSETAKTVKIETGRVFFDVQKQKKGNQFQFKTGTATAAIRGTSGFVEGSIDGIIVSLEAGKMEVTNNKGEKVEVIGGETLVQDKANGMKKFKTPSSGSKKLAKEISKEKKAKKFNADSLENRAKEIDEKNGQTADSLSKADPCEFDPIPQKIVVTEVNVSGKCATGVNLLVNGIAVNPQNGKFQAPVSWDKNAYGTKRIRVKCVIGESESLCQEAYVEYLPPTLNDDSAFVRINKNVHVAMNSTSGLTVSGKFFSEDSAAIVTVRLGKSISENLNTRMANGHFSYTFSPTDPNVSWAETFAQVTLKSDKKTLTDSVAVTFPPKVRIVGSNENQCTFQFSLLGISGGKVLVEESVDGIPTTKATFEKDVHEASFPMLPGTHVYKIFTRDENGNQSEATQTFTCKQ